MLCYGRSGKLNPKGNTNEWVQVSLRKDTEHGWNVLVLGWEQKGVELWKGKAVLWWGKPRAYLRLRGRDVSPSWVWEKASQTVCPVARSWKKRARWRRKGWGRGRGLCMRPGSHTTSLNSPHDERTYDLGLPAPWPLEAHSLSGWQRGRCVLGWFQGILF